MSVLLISPPVSNFAQVHPAICVLTCYLRAHGIEVIQRDLGIEFFNYMHATTFLEELATGHRQRMSQVVERGTLSHSSTIDLAREVRLGALLETTLERIVTARTALRSERSYSSPNTIVDAFETIKDVGRLVSLTHTAVNVNFQRLQVVGAFDDFEALDRALNDSSGNPIVRWVHGVDLPQADILGLSVTYSSQLFPALCIARHWKKTVAPSGVVVLGGSFATNISDSFLSSSRWGAFIDYLVLDDGEESLLELAKAHGHPNQIDGVPNLVSFKDNEVRVSNVHRSVRLRDLPIPLIDLEGIDFDAYLTPEIVLAVPVTRGCYWGKCTFCNISNQSTGPYRVRRADRTVADLRALSQNHGIRLFDFAVDSFHPRGLEQLSEAIIDADLDILWNAEVLLDRGFTEQRLETMHRSGCRHLRFGLESTNAATLKIMQKRNDMDVVRRIVQDCSDFGIFVSLMTIVGFPTESEKSSLETIRFLLDLAHQVSFVTVHGFNVAAGSPIAAVPSSVGIDLERIPGLIQPRYTYNNNNAGCLQPDEVDALVAKADAMLLAGYPQHGQVHSTGVGGWLTFVTCARAGGEFFRRRLVPSSENLELALTRLARRGYRARFPFDLGELEQAVRANRSWRPSSGNSTLVVAPDAVRVAILGPQWEQDLDRIWNEKLGEASPRLQETLAALVTGR